LLNLIHKIYRNVKDICSRQADVFFVSIKFTIANHRKYQKAHSGIISGRQGLGQTRILARCQQKTGCTASAVHPVSKQNFSFD